jgi:hypothetical protein
MNFLGNGLVIHHTPVALAQDAGPGGGTPTGDINLSNILKLVPGDIVAVYLAGKGIVHSDVASIAWPTLLFWLCLLACVLLRFLVTKRAPGGVNWVLIIVTSVAFFVWAHAVNDVGPVIAGFNGSVAGIVAMLLGLFAPVAVPSQPG